MVNTCCVLGCPSRVGRESDLRFFRFPHGDKERCSKWTAAIGRVNWKPSQHTRICNKHFVSGKHHSHPTHRDYVPSIFPAAYKKNQDRNTRRVSRCTKKAIQHEEISQRAREESHLTEEASYRAEMKRTEEESQSSDDSHAVYPRCQNDTLVIADSMHQQFSKAMLSSNQTLCLDLNGDPRNNSLTPDHLPPLSDDIDTSVTFGYPSVCTDNDGSCSTSIVTGLVGDQMRPSHQGLPGFSDTVFSEAQAVMVRKLEDINVSTPHDTEYHFFAGLKDIPETHIPQEPLNEAQYFLNLTMDQPIEESMPNPEAISEDLNLIKLMNTKPKHRTGSGFVRPDLLVAPLQLNPKLPSCSLVTSVDYPVQTGSPVGSAISEHAPSPAPSVDTPMTPAPTTQSPLSIRCFVKNGHRCFEISVRKDLSKSDEMMGLKALFYCYDLCMKLKECVDNPCDLAVASNVSAQFCDFEFDPVNHKLTSKVPSDCVPIKKYLQENSAKIDHRVRQHLLQQVVNCLASIHTGGSDKKMSLWGSFLTWVDQNKIVHLLLDLPVMLAKMEQSCVTNMDEFDPRLEDNKAVLQMYNEMFKPFIHLPSPGLQKLLSRRFEEILASPLPGSRMAKIARNFREIRICKIEVDMLSTWDTVVYCLEQETLQHALSPLVKQLPGIFSACKIHIDYGPVRKEDIAGGPAMKFKLFSLPSESLLDTEMTLKFDRA